MDQIQVGFPLYPGVIQLDVTGAYQVLTFPPHIHTHLIGKTRSGVVSNEGLVLTPTVTFDDCPPLDVICVPGGGMGQVVAMQDKLLLNFLKQQASTARYVTSVCTGSMILAAAGLLQGYKATCHWAFCDQLAMLGVEVVPERVVVDCDRADSAIRVTGAGVTSGIDFGLTLLALLCGEEIAKMAQLMMAYDPAPPFKAGTPETAGEAIVTRLLQPGQSMIDAFLAQTRETAMRLNKVS